VIKSLGGSVIGVAGGGAGPLDANGQIPSSQIPAPNRILAAYKTVITSRVSITALADDPELTIANVVAGTYEIEAFVAANAANNTPGLSAGFSVSDTPVSSSYVLGLAGQQATTLNITQVHVPAIVPAGLAYTLTNANITGIHFRGFVTLDDTVTIAFAWAQAVSDPGFTAVFRGSWLMLRRLGS
jgi:hypothetical protein